MFFQTINLVNLQLIIETFFASFLLANPVYEKREHFILKWIFLSILFCAIGYFFPVYSPSTTFLTVLYWTFMYTVLLLLSIPILMCTYRLKFLNALLICLVSYLIHHVNNIAYSVLISSIEIYFSLTEGVAYQVIRWTITLVVLLITYIIFFSYYYNQRKENLQLFFNNKQLVFFGFAVIAFTIVISSCVRIYYYASNTSGLYILGLFSNFASCLLVTIFFFVFLRHNKIQQELLIEKRIIEQEKKQYELSKENIDSLNMKFHDLKYRVDLLSNQKEIKKEDLQDIYEDIDIYNSVVKTGNKPLDVVLTQYALRAENSHIKFTSIADGNALSFMSDSDIYVLFGNAITNAIEASKNLEDDKRHISLVMTKKGNILSIDIENFFDKKKLMKENDDIITSKNDRMNHGYGLKSMRNIVNKYDGVLNYYDENDIFHLNMTFIMK